MKADADQVQGFRGSESRQIPLQLLPGRSLPRLSFPPGPIWQRSCAAGSWNTAGCLRAEHALRTGSPARARRRRSRRA